MVDYGHASIADAVPVAMFLDNISILSAYLIWSWCPTAGGQESSTRYIKLDRDGLIDPYLFDIPADQHEEWSNFMQRSFDAYQSALTFWEAQVAENPELARIPAAILNDTSDKGQKQVARMRRNYAFDRARYFLPVAALTNMMMVMSARGWVQLCQNLLSHWMPECCELGSKIKEELVLSAPRMVKHAEVKESFLRGHWSECEGMSYRTTACVFGEAPCVSKIDIFRPTGIDDDDFAIGLGYHDNRYAFIGSSVARTSVRFSWSAVALAEIRDFNRHRTGTKFCPLCPVGFYMAADQVPPSKTLPLTLRDLGDASLSESIRRLVENKPCYIGWLLLGSQFMFEHTTTLDKFVYEAELRTGPGAHYRYAAHLRDTVSKLAVEFPELVKGIKLGAAEPE